jgi:nucleoid-associated protein YgaU
MYGKERTMSKITFQVESSVKDYIQTHSERYGLSMSAWVRSCVQASFTAQDITDRIAQARPPIEQYVHQPELAQAETPAAFLSPFGPIPALKRWADSQETAASVAAGPTLSPPPGPAPVIELLPDSNPGGFWTHTVRPGDTLSGLAGHYYGNSARYPLIADANGIHPPYAIYVGQPLVVPKLELEAAGVSTAVFTDCPSWQTHSVMPGDTLYSIAGHYYGAGGEYWRIARCNNIQPPNYVVYVGDRLNIPPRII